MASYLWQLSYSADAWAALLKHPQDRSEAVKKVIENLQDERLLDGLRRSVCKMA
jgi:hypothetical protein